MENFQKNQEKSINWRVKIINLNPLCKFEPPHERVWMGGGGGGGVWYSLYSLKNLPISHIIKILGYSLKYEGCSRNTRTDAAIPSVFD